MYKVQSNIPMPSNLKVNSGRGGLYPFKGMKVGDSFLVPFGNDCEKKIRKKISVAATNYRRSHCVKDQHAYAECPSGLGIRCWRVG